METKAGEEMGAPLLNDGVEPGLKRASTNCFSIDFHFKDLGLRLRKSGRSVLSNVTGSIYAGKSRRECGM